MPEFLQTIITFLGGGVIGAAIQYVSAARRERQQRHSSYTHEQLDRLYGPLYFLTGQNERLLKLTGEILKAHSDHFDGKQWSESPQTQKTVRNESTSTIELSNVYARQAVANNEAIVALMGRNYAMVDLDDVPLFLEFAIDAIRMNREIQEDRLKGIPLEIYQALGDISYSRPEFLERVREKFSTKQKLLRRYH